MSKYPSEAAIACRLRMFFVLFPLANPLEFPYPHGPRIRRILTNEDSGEFHLRRIFKNRPT